MPLDNQLARACRSNPSHTGYDKSNQLTAERRSGASSYANTFVYDPTGNRLVLNGSGTRTTTVFDNANQIKYSTVIAGRTTYTFDANGNQQIVRKPAGARTTTTWNYENQPTLFRMPDGSRVTMTYNANNRRVEPRLLPRRLSARCC